MKFNDIPNLEEKTETRVLVEDDPNWLYTLDEAIQTTIDLRKAVKWLENAKAVKPARRPAFVYGLSDPKLDEYLEAENERKGRIKAAKKEIEFQARRLRDIELYFQGVFPLGMWVLHEYDNRLLALGLAYFNKGRWGYDYALRIELIEHESDVEHLPALHWTKRNYRLVSEWESVISLLH